MEQGTGGSSAGTRDRRRELSRDRERILKVAKGFKMAKMAKMVNWYS